MLTEMNEILERMTSGKQMRTSDNMYLEDEQAQSMRGPVLEALDIRYGPLHKSLIKYHFFLIQLKNLKSNFSEQLIELESMTTECGCHQLLEKCNIS